MSVKKAINDILPQEWDYVLRKNKVLTRVIDLIYENCIPQSWRNNRMHKRSVERIRHLIRNCPFIDCFDARATSEGYDFWKRIDLEIINYIAIINPTINALNKLTIKPPIIPLNASFDN